MRFPLYLDEHVEGLLAVPLSRLGFDVLTTQAAGLSHRGFPDEEQVRFATSQGRAILTQDIKDYSAIALAWAESGERHCGIILTNRRSPQELRDGFILLVERYPDGMENLCVRLPRA